MGSSPSNVPGAGGTQDVAFQMIRALQAAGAGLLSGTDASATPYFPYLVPGFILHRELAALVRAGLTPYQALVTSTRNVAVYFGTLSESGTVAVGKRSDLVLLEGNPLVDIRNTTRIAGVMLGGRWFPRAALEPRVADYLKTW
jgi:imidazolonepropionase-like amidohydrolase